MPDDLSLNLEDKQTPEVDTPSTPEASLPPSQQEQAAEATPALPPSLLARAQQAGLEGLDGIDSSDKFAEYLLDRYMQVQPYADYGRSALAEGRVNGGGHQASQPDNRGEPAESVEEFDENKFFSDAWQVPQLSPAASFLLEKGAFELNDLGMITPAKGYESLAMPHLQEVQAYQQSKAAQNEAFAANPVKFMAEKLLPYFEHKFSGRWQDTVQERFQEYEHQNFESKFIEDNKAWLYTTDGKAFSADGMKFRDAVAELRGQGITDPQRLANYAMKLAGIDTNKAGAGAQEARQEADPTPAQNKSTPPKDPKTGQFVKAEKSKQESFLDEMRRKAKAGTSQGSHEGSGAVPVVANDGELDGMFQKAFQEHMAGAA